MSNHNFITNGYFSAPEPILRAHGPAAALVWGFVWRWQHLKNKEAYISVEHMTEVFNMTRPTIHKALQVLVENGWIIDHTPDLSNKPHHYTTDPSKYDIQEKVIVSATLNGAEYDDQFGKEGELLEKNFTVKNLDSEPVLLERNFTATVKKLSTIKRIKKEIKNKGKEGASAPDPRPPSDLFQIAQALSNVTGLDFDKNKGRLFKEAKKYSLDDLNILQTNYAPEGKWYLFDWRGQKGEKPTLGAILDTWGNLTPPAKNGNGNGHKQTAMEHNLEIGRRILETEERKANGNSDRSDESADAPVRSIPEF